MSSPAEIDQAGRPSAQSNGVILSDTDLERLHNPIEAPWYTIPSDRTINVEHPAVVQNTERALKTIGGLEAVAKCFKRNTLTEEDVHGLELRFRPGDAMAPPIQGRPARTRAMVMKITVPKGQGPKHKEGETVGMALKRLDGRYRAEVVGWSDASVRFRDMADFQWNTRNSKWARNVEENLMELNLPALKRFTMDPDTTCNPSTEIMRPPSFTQITYPFVYGFRQNPAIRIEETASGNPVLINVGGRIKTQTQYGNWNMPTVPQKAQTDPPKSNKPLMACLAILEKLFSERPVWTRRALANAVPQELWPQLKWSYPYVSYYWRSGPWRDTYVKFGVDPRSSKEYAQYQVVAFKMRDVGSSLKSWKNNRSHLFDGRTMVPDGRVWQFCDVTDELLKGLVEIPEDEMRGECDQRDGWYPNNRHFKLKFIMRRKLSNILAGKKTDDAVFETLLAEPDVLAENKIRRFDLDKLGLEDEEEDGSRATKGKRRQQSVEEDDGVVLDDEFGDDDDEEEDGEDDEDEEEEDDDEEGGEGQKERDQRLQTLMRQFMGQDASAKGTGAGRPAAPVVGADDSDDDFEMLGDS